MQNELDLVIHGGNVHACIECDGLGHVQHVIAHDEEPVGRVFVGPAKVVLDLAC
jgi:hypothetical protein